MTSFSQPGRPTATISSLYVRASQAKNYSPETSLANSTTLTCGGWMLRPARNRNSSRTGSILPIRSTASTLRWTRPGPGRIWIVDSEGHNPQQATTDTSEEVAHVAPQWSPEGDRIVFQNIARTKFDIRVVDLASKQMGWITNDFFENLR